MIASTHGGFVAVNNMTMGGDPAPGVGKVLHLLYTHGGVQVRAAPRAPYGRSRAPQRGRSGVALSAHRVLRRAHARSPRLSHASAPPPLRNLHAAQPLGSGRQHGQPERALSRVGHRTALVARPQLRTRRRRRVSRPPPPLPRTDSAPLPAPPRAAARPLPLPPRRWPSPPPRRRRWRAAPRPPRSPRPMSCVLAPVAPPAMMRATATTEVR